MNANELNLTLNIDGVGLVHGTFHQWQDFISRLAQGGSADYRASVRYNQESVTSMVSYLRRTFKPQSELPVPEAFGLQQMPPVPTDGELIKALLTA